MKLIVSHMQFVIDLILRQEIQHGEAVAQKIISLILYYSRFSGSNRGQFEGLGKRKASIFDRATHRKPPKQQTLSEELEALKQELVAPQSLVINVSNNFGGQVYLVGYKDILEKMPRSLLAMVAYHEGMHLKYPSLTEEFVLRMAPYQLAVDWITLWR